MATLRELDRQVSRLESRRLRRQSGRLRNVWEPQVGTTLAADAAAAATSITVDDASVFDESGGSLYIGSQVVRYSGYDDDTGMVTLSAALTEAASTDDSVVRWSTLYNEVETVQYAEVAVEGDRDQADTLVVEVADSLDLRNGDRGTDGENCTIERDGDVWRLVSAHGRPSKTRGLRFESAEPTHAPSDVELAAGSFTHQLRHTGIASSHGFFTTINGVALGSEWWSLDAAAGIVTVTIPDWVNDAPEGYRGFGWPMYAYRSGLTSDAPVTDPADPPIRVPFTIVGHVEGRGTKTSVTFPVGTADGDLFVWAAMARSYATNTCTDSRASLLVDQTLNAGPNTDTTRIWVGTVTSPGTPLTVHAVDLGGVQDAAWAMRVIRPDSPIDFDGVSDSGVQGTGSIPAIAGPVSGAVGVGFSLAGVGSAATHAWGSSPWTGYFAGGTSAKVSIVTQDSESIAATPALTTDAWRGFALGLGLG